MKCFIKTLLTVTCAASLAACATKPQQVTPTYYVDAVVISYERSTVCYVEKKKSGSGKTLLGGLGGGIAGYLIGKHIGGGSGKKIATALFTTGGAAAGAMMMVEPDYQPSEGEKLKCKRDGYKASVTYRDPESGLVVTKPRQFQSRPTKKSTIKIPVYGAPIWVQ